MGADLMYIARHDAVQFADSNFAGRSGYGQVNVTVTQSYSGELTKVITSSFTDNPVAVTPKAVSYLIREDDIVARIADLISNRDRKPKDGSTQHIFDNDILADVEQDVLEINLQEEQNLSLDTEFLLKTETENTKDQVTVVMVEDQEQMFLLAEALENGQYNNLRQILVPKGVIKVIPAVIEAYVVEVGSKIGTGFEDAVEDPFNLSGMTFTTTATPTEYTITSDLLDAETTQEQTVTNAKGLQSVIEQITSSEYEGSFVIDESISDLSMSVTNLLDLSDIEYQKTVLPSGSIEIEILENEFLITTSTVATETFSYTDDITAVNQNREKVVGLKEKQLEAMLASLGAKEGNVLAA